MQEDIENRMVALTVKTTKLTARALAKVLAAVLRYMQKRHQQAQAPQGRQSVKQLMRQGVSTSTIPLNGDTRLFDRVARKWNVDYSFHKTGPKQYLLLFKAGQADAITAAFAEYTKRFMARARDRHVPIREQVKQAARQAERGRPQQRERTREAARDERG